MLTQAAVMLCTPVLLARPSIPQHDLGSDDANDSAGVPMMF
jgi:hypothetical protein